MVVHERSCSTSGVWWEATAIVKRYPSATIIPGVVLGATAEGPHYFIDEQPLLDHALTYVSAALAYYLYLAYAEEIVVEYERGMERITLRDMLRELRDAAAYVWRVLATGLVTLAITGVATGLLVIPGAWLYTRWSLSTLAIRHENLGWMVQQMVSRGRRSRSEASKGREIWRDTEESGQRVLERDRLGRDHGTGTSTRHRAPCRLHVGRSHR